MYVLGYNIDFGYNYAADLITSIKFSEKMTGYISMSILFTETTSEIEVMVNSIKNDLTNTNSLCQTMALTLASNLNNVELLNAISKEVFFFLTNYNEKQMNSVKKALICLAKVIKVNKSFHDVDNWCKALCKLANMKYFEVLLALCGLTINIFTLVGSSGYDKLACRLFNQVLYKMKNCPDEYIYYHIKAPWLQIKITQIMQ